VSPFLLQYHVNQDCFCEFELALTSVAYEEGVADAERIEAALTE
jgi:hypothetical protein